MNITIRQSGGTIFKLNEDMNDWQCIHEDAYLDQDFIAGPGDDGEPVEYTYDTVVCPAPDCTGVQDWEVGDLLDRLGA